MTQGLTARETFLGTVDALAGFISENLNFALPSDYPDEGRRAPAPREVLQDLATLASRLDRGEDSPHWELKASVLAMFLSKAPELREPLAAISMTGLNISRESPFDPLTYAGLSDVLRFIGNGLLDDTWLAAYEMDGDLRVVGEPVDDAVRAGKVTDGLPGRPDKDDDWLREANRTYLDWKTFHDMFAPWLEGVAPAVPSQGELSEAWMSRPYDDFLPGPKT